MSLWINDCALIGDKDTAALVGKDGYERLTAGVGGWHNPGET